MIFLLKLKMGHKATVITPNIHSAFGPGTANECTVYSGSGSFAKLMKVLKGRSKVAGH